MAARRLNGLQHAAAQAYSLLLALALLLVAEAGHAAPLPPAYTFACDARASALSPVADRFALGCEGGAVQIVDPRTGVSVLLADRLGGTPEDLVFSIDGGKLLGRRRGEVTIWDVPSRQVLASLELPRTKDPSLEINVEATRLLAQAGGDGPEFGGVQLFDARSGRLIAALGKLDFLAEKRFSPDGRLVLAKASEGGGLAVYRADDASLVWSLTIPGLMEAAWGPAGAKVVASTHYEARILDSRTGNVEHVVTSKDSISAAELSEDGARLVIMHLFGHTEVYETSTGRILAAFPLGPRERMRALVRLVQGSSRLVWIGEDSVSTAAIASGSPVMSLPAEFTDVTVGPEGLILSMAMSGVLRVLQPQTQAEIACLAASPAAALCASERARAAYDVAEWAGDMRGAQSALEAQLAAVQGISIDDDNDRLSAAETHVLLGEVLLRRDKPTEARKHFEAALSAKGGVRARARAGLGRALQTSGRPAEASAVLQAAVAEFSHEDLNFPSDVEARCEALENLAEALRASGRAREAGKTLEAGCNPQLSTNGNVSEKKAKARLLEADGKLSEAADLRRDALSHLTGDNAGARLEAASLSVELARGLGRQGEGHQAAAIARDALATYAEFFPQDSDVTLTAKVELGRIELRSLSDPTGALATLRAVAGPLRQGRLQANSAGAVSAPSDAQRTVSRLEVQALWQLATGEASPIPGVRPEPEAASAEERILTSSDAFRAVELGAVGPARHEAPIRTISVSPDGKLVVTASEDDTARVWDLRTGVQRRVLPTLGANAIFLATGEVLSIGESLQPGESPTLSLRVWDALSGALRATIGPARDWTTSTDGKVIALQEGDHVIAAFDPGGRRRSATAYPLKRIHKFRLSPHGRFLLVEGTEAEGEFPPFYTYVFRTSDGALVRRRGRPDQQGILYQFCGEPRLLSSQYELTEAASGTSLGDLKPGSWTYGPLECTPDGRFAYTDGQGEAQVWDVASRQRRAPIPIGNPDNPIGKVVLSNDGTRLVVLPEKASPQLWNMQISARITFVGLSTRQVTASAFSSDGRYLVFGYESGAADVWDTSTGARTTFLGNRR